jgi:hypothetical protein
MAVERHARPRAMDLTPLTPGRRPPDLAGAAAVGPMVAVGPMAAARSAEMRPISRIPEKIQVNRCLKDPIRTLGR